MISGFGIRYHVRVPPMSSLSSLTTELITDVPAINGTPSSAQYTQAITDAISDLGRRVPLKKYTTLSIVSGTASYALPSDFLRLIRLAPLSDPSGVLISSDGLVPLARCSREQYTIAAGEITFLPTPTYSLTRDLWYAATYTLSGDAYADLDQSRAQIALMRARAIAIGLQVARSAANAWKHQLGPEVVDKTAQPAALRAAAQFWQEQYESQIRSLGGPIGMRS